jgi:hypothetical protein
MIPSLDFGKRSRETHYIRRCLAYVLISRLGGVHGRMGLIWKTDLFFARCCLNRYSFILAV